MLQKNNLQQQQEQPPECYKTRTTNIKLCYKRRTQQLQQQ